MNVFNRALLIVLALAVLIATTAVLITTLGWLEPAQLAPAGWLRERLEPFAALDAADQRWTVAGCLALVILGLLLLYLEVRPPPPGERRLLLKEDGLGRVTVARDGVQELARREAGRVPGVMEARAKVEEERDGLRILGRLSVHPDVSLPALSQEVQERVKSAVEHHLGRPVATVKLDTQLAPLDGRRRVR